MKIDLKIENVYDWQDCYLNLVMQELAEVVYAVQYTPKCHPYIMVTYIDDFERKFEYYLETRGWTKLPAGEYMHLGECRYLLHVNSIFYYMNIVIPDVK